MKTQLSWFDKIMTAVTFAEANEHETAREFLVSSGSTSENRQKGTECDVILPAELHGAKANS